MILLYYCNRTVDFIYNIVYYRFIGTTKIAITQQLLKEKLTYNSITGEFHWNKTGKRAGYNASRGYFQITINNKKYYSHQLAFLWMTGKFATGCVDHINGITSDNSWKNLREATLSENQYNRKLQLNNKSGIKGVFWDKRRNKWLAQIRVNKKLKHIGYFESLADAEHAANIARNTLHGLFSKL